MNVLCRCSAQNVQMLLCVSLYIFRLSDSTEMLQPAVTVSVHPTWMFCSLDYVAVCVAERGWRAAFQSAFSLWLCRYVTFSVHVGRVAFSFFFKEGYMSEPSSTSSTEPWMQRRYSSFSVYKSNLKRLSLSCIACNDARESWICLICAHKGCGRYKMKHAQQHAMGSKHRICLQLLTGKTIKNLSFTSCQWF